ncbi:MAG: aldehyde dehydrogenase family protein, partial [Hyphomicrobiaceae bacterium]
MNRPERILDDTTETMLAIGRRARAAARELALADAGIKNQALLGAARALRARKDAIIAANARDVEAATARGVSGAFLDRLRLDGKRIEAIAKGLEEIAGLADPVGAVLSSWTRPNGLEISRVRVPIGVVGIIFESRPNVTADAGALCLKAGNAAILRGGSDSFHSSAAIHACLVEGLEAAGLPVGCIQLVPTTDREAVGHML